MTAPYGAKFVLTPNDTDSADRWRSTTLNVDVPAPARATGDCVRKVLWADGRTFR